MQTSDYWQKRTLQVEDALNKRGIDYFHDLESAYTRAAADTEKEILKLYTRLATGNGVSLSEAKRLLTTNELKEFRWSVEEYIKYGRENAISGEWMKQLENASLRYRISRLEAMKIQMQNQVEVLMGHEADTFSHAMGDIYTEGYYRTGHMIQTGFGIGSTFASIDPARIEKVLAKPWAPDGLNFSERIWGKHRPELVSRLHTGLTQSIIRGEDPQKLINKISHEFKVAKSKAGNLVMTESAYFGNLGQQECYNELDVEMQEFCATLDTHTSETCREMDGKVFKSTDIQIGVNAPPLHCRCRSVMVPYFEDNITERAARDPKTGKTVNIPSNMSYKDWHSQFVEGKKPVKPATFKDKLSGVKTDLADKKKALASQQVERQSKNTELKIVNEDIEELKRKRMDLQVKQETYERLKDRDFDAEIAEQTKLKDMHAKRVAKLEAEHSRFYDRPASGTPEREAWREWRKTVDFESLFDDLVDEKSKLSRAEIEIKHLMEQKNIRAGIDIDDVTKRLKKVDDTLFDKGTRVLTLTDDIARIDDDILNARTGIENTYKQAGQMVIEELDGKTFITDEAIEAAQKEMNDARWAYMKADREHYDELYAKYKEICAKVDDLTKNKHIRNAEQVKDVLSQVRELGASDATKLRKVHLKNSRSKVASAIERAYEHYPREWVDTSAAHSGVSLKKTMRGYYSDRKLEIAISGWDEGTQFRCAVHEIGHRFEHTLNGLADVEELFYNRRTNGEKLAWLGKGYGKGELTRKDDFLSSYMGKYYDGEFYELVSMGFEYAYTNPAKLLKDKDMAEWIYGLLTLF